MADNTNTPVTPRNKLPELEIERNGVTLKFKDEEIKRGEFKGWAYPAPVISVDDVNTLIAWIDPAQAVKKLTGTLKSLAQGWWENAEEVAKDRETKQIDLEKAIEVFTKLAHDFSARGESIPDLKAQIDELVDMITSLDFASDPEATSKVEKYSAEIKALQTDIELNRRKPRKSATNDNTEASGGQAQS